MGCYDEQRTQRVVIGTTQRITIGGGGFVLCHSSFVLICFKCMFINVCTSVIIFDSRNCAVVDCRRCFFLPALCHPCKKTGSGKAMLLVQHSWRSREFEIVSLEAGASNTDDFRACMRTRYLDLALCSSL